MKGLDIPLSGLYKTMGKNMRIPDVYELPVSFYHFTAPSGRGGHV